MESFIPYFKQSYYDALNTPCGNNPARLRGDSFLKVFELLEAQNLRSYNIVETGCMRPDHGEFNFGGDGCSTLIFDTFLMNRPGHLISVDINQTAVDYVKSLTSINTTVYCMDSVALLWNLHPSRKYDLVYLDSYDIVEHNPHPSQLHHLKELCAVMKNLRGGSIVVVDDHDAFFTGGRIGKGNYVKDFMVNIGATIAYEGYQIVFIMPETFE